MPGFDRASPRPSVAPPLAAVAAPLVMAGLTGHLAGSGAVDNINDSYNVPVPIFLQS